MIHYIVGDGSTKPLPPHDIRNTVSINEARRLIVNLSMPLADISQMIQDNIFTLDRHQQTLQSHTLSMDEMRKKLYIPVVDLEVTKLQQPSTVCAASKCATMYPVGSLQKWHYKQRCHEPCYLTNVPEKTIGAPELRDCAAMDATKKCIRCGCDFSVHMHVYYLTKTKDSTIEDNVIKNSMLSREQATDKIALFIAKTQDRRKQFENEREMVTRYMAQFAHFLQNNAIIKYNDAYENYIKYMIEREKSLGPLSDLRTIEQFEQLIKQYREAKDAFDEALKLCTQKGLKNQVVTALMIKESIEKLYQLPHTGKKIKELVMCQMNAQSNEYKQTEYHHKHNSNIFTEDNDSEESPNEKSSGSKPRNAPRGQHSRGQRYRSRSRGPIQNMNYGNFNANRQGYPEENHPPPSYYNSVHSEPPSYTYGHHHSSTMQGPYRACNHGAQGHHNTHGAQHGDYFTSCQPNIEVNITRNVVPPCTDSNCRHPACARNLPRGCGDPNCRDPNCPSQYSNTGYQRMYGYNGPPIGYTIPHSSGHSPYGMNLSQQNNRPWQNRGTRGGQRGHVFRKAGSQQSGPKHKAGSKQSGKQSAKSSDSE